MDFSQNSSFSTSVPNLQMAWDSTSIGTFKECAYKYYISMILARAPRSESVHLTFGAHYHKALETYDHARSAGRSFEDGLDEAVRYCLEATVTRSSAGWRPWPSDDPNKNRKTLLRTVVWYLLQFEVDPLETVQLANGKPAVELSFRFEIDLPAPDGMPYLLAGHMDRMVMFEGEPWVLDRKTTKNQLTDNLAKKYKPDNQMGFYDFASQVVWSVPVKGIIIDAAQVLATLSRFRRVEVRRDWAEKDEWFRAIKYYIKLAERAALEEYWPQNDKSCGNYGGCPFLDFCNKSPKVRDEWIKAATSPRLWDPLKVRGDI